MKITESELEQIIDEETKEVVNEMLPALAAAAKSPVGQAVGRAAANQLGSMAKKKAMSLASKQPDVARVLKALSRVKAPVLMQKIDKPIELQDLLMNILGSVKVNPNVIDTVINRVRKQVKDSAKKTSATPEPVGQPPAEE
jgi:uncharacterized protein YpuA (DUF1002 family)